MAAVLGAGRTVEQARAPASAAASASVVPGSTLTDRDIARAATVARVAWHAGDRRWVDPVLDRSGADLRGSCVVPLGAARAGWELERVGHVEGRARTRAKRSVPPDSSSY